MDEIAGEAGLSRREVTAALESVVEPVSLEEPVYTGRRRCHVPHRPGT